MTGPVPRNQATQWAEIRDRIFRPIAAPQIYFELPLPFVSDEWQMVPVASGFPRLDYGDIGPDSGGWPQRGDLPDIEDYSDPLFWCLRDRGCTEFVMTVEWPVTEPVDIPNDAPLYWRVPVDKPAIFDAAMRLKDTASKLHIQPNCSPSILAFDATEEWGVAEGFLEYHLLGGTPAFIEQYYQACGGKDYAMAWFYCYEMFEILEVDMQIVYDMVGWPPPVYPADGGPYIGQDIDWTPMFGDRIKSCGPHKRLEKYPNPQK